ncbi:MAG: 50S ribosomal protein L35 [Patescibacteria group bacterium]|nr:50S ribosomal protein L35 [Patescibacteria group bacterium]
MKPKTKKAYSKRFTITKSGKVLKRYCGQDHFNARDSGNQTRKKRRDTSVYKAWGKLIKASVSK